MATDFGDAPDNALGTSVGNYATLLSDNGPSHTIVAGLKLGANVDGESGTLQSAAANADDSSGAVRDDEDGVAYPDADLVLTTGSTPSIVLRATNTTGNAATLFGWIDYNSDGAFDDALERTSMTIPNGTSNTAFTLTFPEVPITAALGQSYARFRLSTDAAAGHAFGAASDGEVEDYAVQILDPTDGTAISAKTRKIASAVNGGPVLADNDIFGHAITSLGDLDGDGIMDLAVGAVGDDTGGDGRGAVYVLFMNADGTARNTVKIASGVSGGPTLANTAFFGNSVAKLGDLDGDGIVDLAVGSYGDDTGGSNRGAVHVLFMNANGSVKGSQKIASGVGNAPALANGNYFGKCVASLGDLDGDGIGDLAVSARNEGANTTNRGLVYVLTLNANGTVKTSTKIAGGVNGGPTLADFDSFGFSLASLGDLDGDGVGDMAVGTIGDDTMGSSRGAVHVLFMNSSGTVKSKAKIASGTNGAPNLVDFDFFGWSLAALGDLDGDGVGDLAVGATGDDASGVYRAGAVHVLLLTPAGAVKESHRIASDANGGPATSPSDWFGSSVTMLGDVNKDGAPDLAVAASHDDAGGAERGAVYTLFLRPFETDFGDAPDSGAGTSQGNYQTARTDNGPRHTIVAGLKLGTNVDVELDAAPSNSTDGDDLFMVPGHDDEDGLVEPNQDLLVTVGTAPQVRVRATNTTGAAATLYGWIDYNRDGAFDNATERASIAVPSDTNNGTFKLNFPMAPSDTSAGGSFARFRLSTVVAAADPTGLATDGEVEDYAASITIPSNGAADSSKPRKVASALSGGPTLANFDFFGSSVASLGDVDGDGVIDLAIGASGDDTGGPDRGAVYVQFMNANGTVKSSVKIASGTTGAPMLADDDFFGSAVASLGDMDGDGITELAVGARGDHIRGAVHVLFLQATGGLKGSATISGATIGESTPILVNSFGSSLASLGDLDGDGIGDLVVGSPSDFVDGAIRGAVHVLFMNADATVKSSAQIYNGANGGPALSPFDYFGSSVASLGDLDGDGVSDLAVGADGVDAGAISRAGAVYVLFMNADGTAKNSVKIASGMNGGPILAEDDYFGSSVTSLGDLDGDGVTDLAVGAEGDNTGGVSSGAIQVLFMNSLGTVKSRMKIASATNGGPPLASGDLFGSSVASLGDLDGDGVTDFAVGARFDDTGGTNRGAVHMLFLKSLAVASPPADFDSDFDVDGADFLTWQRGFGLTVGATRAQGNANPAVDGDVDGDDLAAWKGTFGAAAIAASTPAGAAAVTASDSPAALSPAAIDAALAYDQMFAPTLTLRRGRLRLLRPR